MNPLEEIHRELIEILEVYIEKEKAEEILKDEKILSFVYKYWCWFKRTKFLNIDAEKDNLYLIALKLAIRFVIAFALVENFYTHHGGEIVKCFFHQLDVRDKFLFNWLIEMRDPKDIGLKWKEQEQKRRNELRFLLSSLFQNDVQGLNKELDERIRYLYALRSQVVHRGEISFFPARFKEPFLKIIKVVEIFPYRKKKIKHKLLIFNDKDYNINFENIFEDFIFISLIKHQKLELRESFQKNWNETFYKIMKKISKSYYDLGLYQEIEEYLNQIENRSL